MSFACKRLKHRGGVEDDQRAMSSFQKPETNQRMKTERGEEGRGEDEGGVGGGGEEEEKRG